MPPLVVCLRCQRHVREGAACPFCDRRCATTSAAALALASLVTVGCGKSAAPNEPVQPSASEPSGTTEPGAASEVNEPATPAPVDSAGPALAPDDAAVVPPAPEPEAHETPAPVEPQPAPTAASPSAGADEEPAPRPRPKYGMPRPRPKYGMPSPPEGGEF